MRQSETVYCWLQSQSHNQAEIDQIRNKSTYFTFFLESVQDLHVAQLYQLLVYLVLVCSQMVDEALLVLFLLVVIVWLLEFVSWRVEMSNLLFRPLAIRRLRFLLPLLLSWFPSGSKAALQCIVNGIDVLAVCGLCWRQRLVGLPLGDGYNARFLIFVHVCP